MSQSRSYSSGGTFKSGGQCGATNGPAGSFGSGGSLADYNDTTGGREFTYAEGVDAAAGLKFSDDSTIPSGSTITEVKVYAMAKDQQTGGQDGEGALGTYTSSRQTKNMNLDGVWNSYKKTFDTNGNGSSWTPSNIWKDVYFFLYRSDSQSGSEVRCGSIQVKFTFDLPTPGATTDAASSVTGTTATLNGTVDPNTATSTYDVSYYFEYGPTVAYGSTTSTVSGVTGDTPSSINEAITGLAEGTTYHFRLVVLNDDETVNGDDTTFTTESAGAGDTALVKL